MRVSEKTGINKKGTKTLYFTHMPRSPQWIDLYQIWFRGPLTDVINCAEFCCSQLMGFDSVRGQIRHLPLTWLVAVNTVLVYRAACDPTVVYAN